MRKYLWALMALATLTITGCDTGDEPAGDNEIENGDNTAATLVGTTWTCKEFETDIDIAFAFFKDNKVVETDYYRGVDPHQVDYPGTYEFDGTAIRLDLVDDGEPFWFTGTVEGDKMTLYDEDGDLFDVFVRD